MKRDALFSETFLIWNLGSAFSGLKMWEYMFHGLSPTVQHFCTGCLEEEFYNQDRFLDQTKFLSINIFRLHSYFHVIYLRMYFLQPNPTQQLRIPWMSS